MTAVIDFYYDLASPNSYMASRVLPQILERTGATANYIPCLLGGIFKATGHQAPWMTFANVKPKMAFSMVEFQRFIKKHNLTRFQMNPHFPLNTLMIMRGAVAADAQGKLEAYIEAGERLLWEDGVNLQDPEVFVEKLTEQGLDGAALLAKTQDAEVKAKLIENTNAAVERGVFGVPTFFLGDEMFFGKDQLRDLEDELNAQG